MAKMRVYELARDLKMDNKELVRRLIELGLDVRNHMSVLSEEQAQEALDQLKAATSEVVEEKRITTRVIRRRRKKVETEADLEEAEALEAEEVLEAEEALQEALEAKAEPPAEAPEMVEAAPHAAEAAPVPEAAAEPELAPQEAAEELPPVAKEESLPVEEKAEARAETTAAAEARAVAAEPEKEPQVKAKKSKTAAKKARRARFDQPARIISRPTPPPAPAEAERFEGPPAARPRPSLVPAEAPAPELDSERSKSKRKKSRKAGTIPDDEFLMRKARVRRKEILDKADLYDGRPGRDRRRGGGAAKRPKKTAITMPKAIKRRIKVGEAIVVGELAKRMGIKAAELVGRLLLLGMKVTVNQALDVEDAGLVANEFGFEIERTSFEEDGFIEKNADRPEDMQPRPPVVTIMGHVDHGKTSLLDTIRRSNVVDGEAGGITQHIGAYEVNLDGGGKVVFVDTPGHQAFTQMRARGAQVTDVVVLVVAADDGVMEQTKEAISHSRAAEVPILVAINKIDKPGADPKRVSRELGELGLVPEDWGGDTIMVEVSAKTGQGVDTLLEMLQLQSEILDLKANPNKPARGRVLEARLDKGRGPMSTLLVQEGTLKAGDVLLSGVYAGKVRAMFDHLGRQVDAAGPSIPVEVQGLGGVPEAGDDFLVLENEKTARQIAEHRALKKRESELSAQTRLSLEGFLDQMKEGETLELKLVVKADVQGSVEALVEALGKLGNERVKVNIIHSATGAITETDVMLAAASQAIIIGFNVRPTGKVSEIAESEGVEVRTYEIIYQILEDVTAALSGLLPPTIQEEVIGRVEVRQTFGVPKVGTVAGSYVTSGKVERGAHARLLREGVVVATTRIQSLKRFKEDVKEVLQGFECGIGLENYNDIKVGDEIEFFVTREIAAEL